MVHLNVEPSFLEGYRGWHNNCILILRILRYTKWEVIEMENQSLRKSVLQKIQNENIKTIRVNLVDLTGISRTRNVPIETFVNRVMDNGIDYPSAMFFMDSSGKLVDDGRGISSGFPSWVLMPDLSTFVTLPWAPGTAKVIADVIDQNGDYIPYSPRTKLKQVLKKLEEMGLTIKGSFEFEFYVFKQEKNALLPILNSTNSYSEIDQIKVNDILLEIMDELNKMGSSPESGNTEYGTGQFEITHRPLQGINVADMAMYYRSVIKELLLLKGLKATFMSQPLADSSSSGGHLHLSLYNRKNRNEFYDANESNGLSNTLKKFLAGIIHHSLGMNALCNSTINSYKRLSYHYFAPKNITWGLDNRTTMLRIPRFRDQDTRFELRLPGADTNPYLTLAAVISAGIDGLENNYELPEMVSGNAYEGNAPLLQTDLLHSLRDLEKSEFFGAIFGEELLSQYKLLRKSEYERYSKQITEWEINEYMDLF
jgi:glutamine synthetase